jgi:hydrogenase expression/formation protein HypE
MFSLVQVPIGEINMERIVTLHHGSGGTKMHALIGELFIRNFSNRALNELSDAAILENPGGRLAFTTDSYVVDPIFFTGGDIGKLAVCGTLNDLAVSFAKPLAISASFILEEGLSIGELDRIVRSMASEAKKAGVPIVTGDTKVVPKGKCDKVFINTSGIGIQRKPGNGSVRRSAVRTGDSVILSGPLGDHAISILLVRESFRFHAKVQTDCANLYPMIEAITTRSTKIRMMRDVTRGGLSSVLNEIAGKERKGILITEERIPVRKEVRAVCDLLGFDPLDLANEGKFVTIAGKTDAEEIVAILRRFHEGKMAMVIGEIVDDPPGKVLMKTVAGGTRFVDMVSGEQLPRIC